MARPPLHLDFFSLRFWRVLKKNKKKTKLFFFYPCKVMQRKLIVSGKGNMLVSMNKKKNSPTRHGCLCGNRTRGPGPGRQSLWVGRGRAAASAGAPRRRRRGLRGGSRGGSGAAGNLLLLLLLLFLCLGCPVNGWLSLGS